MTFVNIERVMTKNKSSVSGLAVLLISSTATPSHNLFQQLCKNGCTVTPISLEEILKEKNIQNFYDIILFEIEQLTAAVLRFWASLKTDPTLCETPVIVVAPQKDIATIKTGLPARPLVCFIQRDQAAKKKIIEQAIYVDYLRNRYN